MARQPLSASQSQASLASSCSTNTKHDGQSLQGRPPPSPSRLAKVLRAPYSIVPSQRSSSLQGPSPSTSASTSPSSPARSPIVRAMGAATSQPQQPPLLSPSKADPSGPGGRLRRVFQARRKKADDMQAQPDAALVPAAPAPAPPEPARAQPPPTTATAQPPPTTATAQPPPQQHPAALIPGAAPRAQQLLAGERQGPDTPPPLPPPKSPRMLPPTSAGVSPQDDSSAGTAASAPASASAIAASFSMNEPTSSPVISDASSPAIADAPASDSAPPVSVNVAPEDKGGDAVADDKPPVADPTPISDAPPPAAQTPITEQPLPAPTRRPRRDPELERMVDEWRKSDATASSHRTARPRSGGGGGTRTRPVSVADSLHSTSTVVGPAAAGPARRLSALLTEAGFVMTEADEDADADEDSDGGAATSKPTGAKLRARHSVSLHFSAPATPTTPSASGTQAQQQQQQHSQPPSAVTRAAAAGIIGPTRREPHSPASQIRGRLAAWTATAPSPSPSPSPLEPPPPPGPAKWTPAPATQPAQTHAQTNNGGGGGGSSGVFGFGKRAVERMGRAFGVNTNNNNHGGGGGGAGGYTSGSSTNGDSPRDTGGPAAPPDEWRRPRRHTPNASSGTWSVSTGGGGGGSGTDESGAGGGTVSLGERMRPPRAARGLVFGQPLARCVVQTALEPVRVRIELGEDGEIGMEGDEDPGPGADVPLEERMMPALVVRCVQHIMRWGLEEEGLFRISGRASHVARLRAEFDTGADYDLRECPPGDLDPHAVSSIFKAYLRELPEPILTKQLNPLFEAAMATENEARKSLDGAAAASGGSPTNRTPRRSALPANPRDGRGLLKPPSLTTLAMPSFAGMRPPSRALLDEFAALIARLPRAHRDLLRTVTELIKATAARRETRMPLSNLTVVFCPSLAMSPPILRVLCEAEDIWHGPRTSAPSSAVASVPEHPTPAPADVEATSTSTTDDAASYASREPWPALSSPSSSSLATPGDDIDSASDGAPPFGSTSATGAEFEALARALLSQKTPSGPTFCVPVAPGSESMCSAQESVVSAPESSASSTGDWAVTAPSSAVESFPPSAFDWTVVDQAQSHSEPQSAVDREAHGHGVRRFPSRSAKSSWSSKAPPIISAPIPLPRAQTAPGTPVSAIPTVPLPSASTTSENNSNSNSGAGQYSGINTSTNGERVPRAKKPSITAIFSKRSLSSLRQSRVLGSLSPVFASSSGSTTQFVRVPSHVTMGSSGAATPASGSFTPMSRSATPASGAATPATGPGTPARSASGAATPATPMTPASVDGTMVTAPSRQSTADLTLTPPPQLDMDIGMSPLRLPMDIGMSPLALPGELATSPAKAPVELGGVPAVVREDDDNERLGRSSTALPTHKRGASSVSTNLLVPEPSVVPADSAATTASTAPASDPQASSKILEAIRPSQLQLDATKLQPLQGADLSGLSPLTDLPEPYNRLSLWEDAGEDIVDGEWASNVLLAADAGWLGAADTRH